MKKSNYVGRKYERLTVIEYSYTSKGNTYWLCQCECGNLRTVSRSNLVSGHTRSCGCLKSERDLNRLFIIPEQDIVVVFYNNLRSDYFVTSLKWLDIVESYTWTAHDDGQRIKPVTYIDNKKWLHFGQVALGIYGGEYQVDHINHVVWDYRSCNIRSATRLQNMCNTEKGIGSIKHRDGGCFVEIPTESESGKITLGPFDAEDKARDALKNWLNNDEHFREFTFENSQRISRENWSYFLDEELDLLVPNENGKNAVDEIMQLPVRNIYRLLLKRYYALHKDVVRGKNTDISKESVLLMIYQVIKDYKASKREYT